MAKWRGFRGTKASEMTFVLLVGALMSLFLVLHLNHWAVGILFIVYIPVAAIKAFVDYRRKRDVIARISILDSARKSN